MKRAGMTRKQMIAALEERRKRLAHECVAISQRKADSPNPEHTRCCIEWENFLGGQIALIDQIDNVLRGAASEFDAVPRMSR